MSRSPLPQEVLRLSLALMNLCHLSIDRGHHDLQLAQGAVDSVLTKALVLTRPFPEASDLLLLC